MPPGSANRELRSSEFLLEDVKLLLVDTVIYFLMMLKIPKIYIAKYKILLKLKKYALYSMKLFKDRHKFEAYLLSGSMYSSWEC